MKRQLLILILVTLSTIANAQLNGMWSTTQPIAPTTMNAAPFYVSAVDASVCWIAEIVSSTVACREFARTIDGGTTWTSQVIATNSTTHSFSSIFGLNANTAYACFYGTSPNGGAVYATFDGGATWTKQTTGLFTNTNSFADFVYFFNDTDGVVLGDPINNHYEIYTTINGGTTWTAITSPPTPLSGNEYGLTSAYCAMGNTVWAGTTEGRILKSTDKGLNWTAITTNAGANYIGEVSFKDDMNGMAISTDGTSGDFIGLIKTTDGGATWTTIGDGSNDLGGFFQPGNVTYVPGTAGTYVLTAAGTGDQGSSYTPDDGVTWVPMDLLPHFNSSWKGTTMGWATTFDQSLGAVGASRWVDPSGINEFSKNDLGTVYPNPASEVFTVALKEIKSSVVKISVYNMLGKEIFQNVSNAAGGAFRKTINCSTFAKGAYIVKIETGNAVTQSKLIIK